MMFACSGCSTYDMALLTATGRVAVENKAPRMQHMMQGTATTSCTVAQA